MKRKHLLFTLLLALMVPLAALAQVERTVTVFNGNDINAHIPVDGGHGTLVPAKNQFIMDKADLSDLAGKQITKMVFHVVNPNITMKTGNHLPYSVLLAEVDVANFGNAGLLTENLTNAHTVASGIQLELTGNTLVINFDRAYTYSGNNNLLVQFSCSSAINNFTPYYESYELRFFGVNASRAGIADLGMGIYRHYGFVPKTTFTYLDEATWSNTNRPQNLQVQADSDGYRLNVNWQAPTNFSGSYQALCVAHGTTPDWSNAETTSNTSTFFSGLNSNAAYDIYVRAKYPSLPFYSAPAKAIAMTKHIANLDNGNLYLDFEDAYIPNGITASGNYSHMLDIFRYWYTDFGYGSYNMHSPSGTVILPSLAYQDANNGVIMEFDLKNATDLQVQFYKQGNNTTTLGSFSATGWTHYTVRAEGLGAQNTAYFQLVSANAFDIDNIRIYKAPTTMKPYNIQASNITTNSATITWDDDNTGTVTHYLRYKKTIDTEWQLLSSSVTSPYVLTGNTSNPLETYTQYEVQLMAQRSSTDYSDWTDSFVFATACPATQTTYTQSFTNLSDLPSYWRVAKGDGVNYSVSSGHLAVSNTSYQGTSYGTTYTAYTTLDAYVIMPYFENLQSLQLSFKAGRTAGSYNELVVGVMSDPFDVTTFSTLETRVLNGPTTTYSFNLANAACQHGHIVIRLNHYESNLQSVWFDDFVVTRFDEPTELIVSNVTNTSATLAWTSQASEFEVQYKTTSASTWTSVSPNPTTNTCTISNLTNNTEYEAQIRAKNGQNQYSPWASFGTFKTLRQEAVVVNASNAFYNEDFESGDGDWILNNGTSTNYWCRSFGAGELQQIMPQTGNKSIYITDGTTTGTSVYQRPTWQYTKMNENQYQSIPRPSLVYLTKIFNLSAGQYTFNFDYKVKGKVGEDYLRVFLLPADMELTGTNSSTFPDGYGDWYYLDNGSQVAQTPNNNTTSSAFVSFGNGTGINNVVQVYSGGEIEPGNYMMVFAWRNEGSARVNDAVQYPAAIDNVSVTWSSLINGPDFALVGTTDTEAALNLYAPASGLTPTSYELQYEPALDHNNYVGAPIASFNATESPLSVTLTGLMPHTLYNVRLRSVYTTSGNSIYSDWVDASSCFTTKYPRPTDLAVVDQTSSWAYLMWSPVEIALTEDQYINYWWQLTTDPNDWGDQIEQGLVSNSLAQNMAPGTYYFHAKTIVYENNVVGNMGESDWSEPLMFTIAPWNDPVTVFPLTQDFEDYSDRFADGITLGGDYEHLGITSYSATGMSTPEGGTNQYKLQFHSCSNKTAYLVLPPLRPSTGDALVSFWWYHDDSDNNANEGVTIEYGNDGSSWTTWGTKITRYAETTGWVKYQQVVPVGGTGVAYIRLRFDASNSNQWTRCCYLDDLKVNNFASYQPYISDVYCGNTTTANITLYDFGFYNGWPSSAFQVQYREYREPGQTQEEWSDPQLFSNSEPNTFVTLPVTGLQPTTLYEFRACARVSVGSTDFAWSEYCEPYRQWTGCGTCTIMPNHNYIVDFEDTFYLDCWTADGGWTMQHSGGYNGSDYCAYHATGSIGYMTSPEIDFSGCNNVILRFWSKGKGVVWVYYGEDYANHNQLYISDTNDWTMIELSLCYFMDKGPVKLVFTSSINSIWYVDDVSILANVYNVKIYDRGSISSGGFWNAANNWFPNGVPTENDDVLVMSTANVTGANGFARTIDFGVSTGNLVVTSNGVLTATTVNASQESQFEVKGIANVTTLNAGEANSVIVKEGGVLNATTITVTNAGANSSVVIKDGGQVKTANSFYGAIEKNITGYGAENVNDNKGYYLIATPAEEMINRALVPKNGDEYLFDQVDVYQFNQLNEKEWDNLKCSLEGGCEGLGHINQGEIHGNTLMQHKKGYLYARQNDGTVRIEAGPVGNSTFPATSTDVNVSSLVYSAGAEFAGWNLIGNPYTCNAYVKVGDSYISYYRMNSEGDQIVLASYDDPIKPCEGVFVQCTNDLVTRTVTFTSTAPGRGNSMDFSLRKSNTRSADIIDRVRISFGEGQNLGHLDLMADPNRLYIPLKEKDFAEVHSQLVGTMPLNFEAAADGAFTLNFNNATEGMAYCHLLDNLTGADVDLLQQPEYSFEARVSDYPSRFKVVFVAQEDGSSTGSETFAFNNNGNWIILNEGRATLQVIDVNGRILSNEQIEGCAETHINASAGVYMIRLINGENVRVQKVVVR